jgi:hypothetical protein
MSPKNAAAVALGRRGGRAYAENTSADDRKDRARKAAEARWSKIKAEHDQNMASIDRSLANVEKTGRRIDAAMKKLKAARTKNAKKKSPPPEE